MGSFGPGSLFPSPGPFPIRALRIYPKSTRGPDFLGKNHPVKNSALRFSRCARQIDIPKYSHINATFLTQIKLQLP